MPTYILKDGAEQQRLTPRTFQIPDEKDRLNVSDGVDVKLGFVTTEQEKEAGFKLHGVKCECERMWVEVTGREAGTNIYYGRLQNHPVFISGVSIGDSIQFEPQHILDIVEGE